MHWQSVLVGGRLLSVTTEGVAVSCGPRQALYRGTFLAVLPVDDGDPFGAWALAADGGLWRLAAGRRQRRHASGVHLLAGQPNLLVYASDSGHLTIERGKTMVRLPLNARPLAIAALSPAGPDPALVLVASLEELLAISWWPSSGAIQRRQLATGRFDVLLALPKPRPVLIARGPAPPWDRLSAWRYQAGPWFGMGLHPLPTLLVQPEIPLLVENGPGEALSLVAGVGTWCRWVDGSWLPVRAADCSGTLTLIYEDGASSLRSISIGPRELLPATSNRPPAPPLPRPGGTTGAPGRS